MLGIDEGARSWSSKARWTKLFKQLGYLRRNAIERTLDTACSSRSLKNDPSHQYGQEIYKFAFLNRNIRTNYITRDFSCVIFYNCPIITSFYRAISNMMKLKNCGTFNVYPLTSLDNLIFLRIYSKQKWNSQDIWRNFAARNAKNNLHSASFQIGPYLANIILRIYSKQSEIHKIHEEISLRGMQRTTFIQLVSK